MSCKCGYNSFKASVERNIAEAKERERKKERPKVKVIKKPAKPAGE